MIAPRPLSTLTELEGAFPGPQLRLVRGALPAGNTAGRLWQLTFDPGRLAHFLWDQGNNVFYLAGDSLTAEALEELEALIAGEVQPASIQSGAHYFRARGVTPALDAQLPGLFPGVPLERRAKRFYAYQADKPPVVAQPTLAGVKLLPIDHAFLESEWENGDDLRREIAWMWPGTAEQAIGRFLETGLGSAAVLGRRLVCWCTAEYVSARCCGIGIETIEECQRHGIATATTAHFVAAALQRGLTPFWECDGANLPSVRVAEKAGFQLVEEGIFWTGLFPS
jgi:RimJ/RimL family protein N-acetyltransferase